MDDGDVGVGQGRQTQERFSMEVHLSPEQVHRLLRQEALDGLTASPKELSPKWFYDERGARLFEEITRQPEYYPTRSERKILLRHAQDIAALAWADTLVELGSGSSEKTRLLIRALREKGSLLCFLPVDVSSGQLEASSRALVQDFPGLRVHAVVGDFEHHLAHLPRSGRRLIAFLGGTIGNFKPRARARFLAELAGTLSAGDSLLLGTDLVKDVDRLVQAYDDAAGVTAQFNKNVLSVLNRELGASFDPDRFDHVARYNEAERWMEMTLRAREGHTVSVKELGLELRFEAGEELRTEVSAKFRREDLDAELAAAGLTLVEQWTDEGGDYALSLAMPAGRLAQH